MLSKIRKLCHDLNSLWSKGLTCGIAVVSMHFSIRVENSLHTDQMASSEII